MALPLTNPPYATIIVQPMLGAMKGRKVNTELKTTLRLPDAVHAWLKGRAKSNRRSANGEIIVILERAMIADAKEIA